MFHVVVVHNNKQRNVQKSVLPIFFWLIRLIEFFFLPFSLPSLYPFQVILRKTDKTCRSHGVTGSSLRASSSIWASEASLARTRERGAARLVSLAQIGELARRLNWLLHCQSLVPVKSPVR